MNYRKLINAFLCLAVATPAAAETTPATPQTAGPPWSAEVSVPSTRHIEFTSTINGGHYALSIHVPLTPAPPEGHPVIYVLDGDFHFGMASDISMTIGNPARTPVVVAIGHDFFGNMAAVAQYAKRNPDVTRPVGLPDIGAALNAARFQEFTLPVAPEHRAPVWTGLTPENVGGVDDFLKVIEMEIKPKVAATVPVNAADQTLFGHSIAGLAVLRALFTEPEAFRTFIAASPSIWWNADAVLENEQEFGVSVEAGQVSPRVLITVGANEPDSPNPPESFIASLPGDKATELRTYVQMASQWSGMVSGSRALAERLETLHGGTGYKVQFVAFDGESHGSVVPAALSRGMHFAFDE